MQYAEDIQEAYKECEHFPRKPDFTKLNRMLLNLMVNARVDGLTYSDFEELVGATLPQISWTLDIALARKAA